MHVPDNHADVIPREPFTQEQLHTLAEQFKKNGFELTPALAEELQWTADIFFSDRNQYQKTLRISEERKNCEAFRDLFAELTKRFRNWDDPLSRLQFVERVTEPYWQARKELDNDSLLEFEQAHPPPGGRIYKMLEEAEQLSQTLHGLFTDVLRRLPADARGPRKDWPLQSLILRLKVIWEKGTAKKAGRSRNPRTREIVGPFVRFVRVCLTYLEPEKPYSSLGETIHKVLQAETVTSYGKNSPKK